MLVVVGALGAGNLNSERFSDHGDVVWSKRRNKQKQGTA